MKITNYNYFILFYQIKKNIGFIKSCKISQKREDYNWFVVFREAFSRNLGSFKLFFKPLSKSNETCTWAKDTILYIKET